MSILSKSEGLLEAEVGANRLRVAPAAAVAFAVQRHGSTPTLFFFNSVPNCS